MPTTLIYDFVQMSWVETTSEILTLIWNETQELAKRFIYVEATSKPGTVFDS
jgi:hypothetical protein